METTDQKPKRVCRKFSTAEREALLDEYAESGMTIKAFCQQRGINLGTFHGWRKRYSNTGEPEGFAAFKVPFSSGGIEIRLPSGEILSFPACYPIREIALLINQLRKSSC